MLFNVLSLLVFVTSAVSTTYPISTSGNDFVNSITNERFLIKGVDYQPGGSSNLTDPLADEDGCSRDIVYFKQLGLNTVRVYSVDNTQNHDSCMELLSDAGIYVLLDVNLPEVSISRSNAACSYNAEYLEQVFATVKSFSGYNNTLGFFAGNEVINNANTTSTASYVKAVVRDMKTYIQKNKLRDIPVGYSAADVEENRIETSDYFNCGDDATARVDMFGFNDYSWCGQSSYTVSGYDQKVAAYSNYSIPLFLSEFGCNKVTPRIFTEVGAIYSDEMTGVFSGGLVYEYSQEASNYGLVQIDADNTNVTKLQDFDNLQSQYSQISLPTSLSTDSSKTYSDCPPQTDLWQANNTLPDMPSGAEKFLNGSDPVGQGFNGETQWACYEDDSSSSSSASSSSTASSSSSSGSSGSKTSSSSGSSATGSSSSSSSSSTSTGSNKKSSGIRVNVSHGWGIIFLMALGFV